MTNETMKNTEETLLSNRKKMRRENHDYGCTGTFFVTTCTHLREHIFGEIVNGVLVPSRQGCVASVLLRLLPKFHKDLDMLSFVVMPDHIHLLLYMHNEEGNRPSSGQSNDFFGNVTMKGKAKTLSSLISTFKSAITRECRRLGLEMEWQESFYDHIVRSADEEANIRKYINENPIRWEIDKNGNDVWM